MAITRMVTIVASRLKPLVTPATAPSTRATTIVNTVCAATAGAGVRCWGWTSPRRAVW